VVCRYAVTPFGALDLLIGSAPDFAGVTKALVEIPDNLWREHASDILIVDWGSWWSRWWRLSPKSEAL
jgi:hypothetical protein